MIFTGFVCRTGTFGNLWFFYNFHLSDVSFHWYRTNVNVKACQCCISNLLNKKTTGHVWQSHYIQNNKKNVWRTIGPPSMRLLSDLTKICPLRSNEFQKLWIYFIWKKEICIEPKCYLFMLFGLDQYNSYCINA